jgi:alpha-L-fucosidase
MFVACTDYQADIVPETYRLSWFKKAKFGMFIHWGPYSNLAGEWNGRRVPVGENAEWIMEKLEIPRDEYRELARQFHPVEFDAKTWVQLAKNTGMKYLVITAKHHDGFAMYDSEVSDYNIVDWTPFRRDPIEELADECRKAGIKFCVYYSHREDWDEPYAYGNDWDFDFVPEENLQQFENRYLDVKAKPQVRELITNYGPLGLIWFDRGPYTQEQAKKFVQLARELQPDIIINGRVGSYGQELVGDYQNMNDNGMPIGGIEEYWESPQTLNETWGYSKFDHGWKSTEEVIHRLVAIVSQGGNYLLNIGPTGTGAIPEPSVKILNEVGQWLEKNNESIYDCGAGPLQRHEWGWTTVKGHRLYLHVQNWPDNNELIFNGLRTGVQSANFLVDASRELPVQQNHETIRLKLPQNPLDAVNTVIVLHLAGTPEVSPPVVSAADDGGILLDYITAKTHGNVVKRFNRKGKFHIAKWTAAEDSISWQFTLDTPGEYRVEITYAANREWAGKNFVISSQKNLIKSAVKHTGDWYEYKTVETGTIKFASKGTKRVTIYPETEGTENLMYFKSLELIPSR